MLFFATFSLFFRGMVLAIVVTNFIINLKKLFWRKSGEKVVNENMRLDRGKLCAIVTCYLQLFVNNWL